MILVYTGPGKGKTSAAIGQALRAAGRGLSVDFGQFMKRDDCAGEQPELAAHPRVRFRACGAGFFRDEKDRALHRAKALELLAWALAGDATMLILDESLYALKAGLLFREELEKFLDRGGDKSRHLTLTGRDAPDWLISLADIVTEMRPIKHCYQNGVTAIAGIEF